MNARIDIPKDEIAAFCQRNGIKRLALFGSVLRDDFTAESDVDVIVEFEPGKTPGLEFLTMQDELSEIYGRRVDLHTFRGVESNPNWLLRNEILNSAEAVYEQT
ncbi:MAG: nucleotidyltransferase family protein [Gemmatimonadota bacterium]|nr:nucleotidyltransferase family protein [Gemmatimonadota bacterium]